MTLLFPVDLILMPACFIANLLSIHAFYKQRKYSRQSRKTVEKYGTNLLLICVGEFFLHACCVSSDVSFYRKKRVGKV